MNGNSITLTTVLILTVATYVGTILMSLYVVLNFLEDFSLAGELLTAIQYHSDQYAYPTDMQDNLDAFNSKIPNNHRFAFIASTLILLPILSMIFLGFFKGVRVNKFDKIAILILFWLAMISVVFARSILLGF